MIEKTQVRCVSRAMDDKYRSYQRIHPVPHAYDHEQGKIAREAARAARATRSAEMASRSLTGDGEDDAVLDDLAAETAFAERERRNAKRHKERLKHLSKDPYFV